MITTVTDKQGNKYHLSSRRISRGVSFSLDGDEGRIGYANIIDAHAVLRYCSAEY